MYTTSLKKNSKMIAMKDNINEHKKDNLPNLLHKPKKSFTTWHVSVQLLAMDLLANKAPPSYQPIEGVLGILQFPLIAQNNKSSLTTSKEQAPPAPLQQKQHQAPPLLLEPPDLLRVYLQLPALHSAPPAAPAQGTPPPIRAARLTTSAPKLCYDSGREPEHHHRGQVPA